MKKSVVLLLLILILMTGCDSRIPVESILGRIFVLNTTQTSPPTEIMLAEPPPMPITTPTPIATQNLPKAYDTQRQKIRQVMEGYGFVDEYYLSDAYWEQLYERITQFGTANKIPALEFHGNNYSMYDGAYSINPQSFYGQIQHMMANQYHFVTIHELKGFLEGWLDLPKRSIILTTDSGAGSQESFTSIIGQFSELENDYGYKPHMQSYIWTAWMGEEESPDCKDNACWKVFIGANKTGFFTFGSHSESHVSFEFQDTRFLRSDLTLSKQKILENTGMNVYALSWPYESCSWDLDALRETGISFGFGGFSKSYLDLFVAKADKKYNCLPRVFPPNPSGYSSRPVGFTLEDILKSQEN